MDKELFFVIQQWWSDVRNIATRDVTCVAKRKADDFEYPATNGVLPNGFHRPKRALVPENIHALATKVGRGDAKPDDCSELERFVEVWLATGGNASAKLYSTSDSGTLLQYASTCAQHIPLRIFQLLVEHGAVMQDGPGISGTPGQPGSFPLRSAVRGLRACLLKGDFDAAVRVERVVRLLINAGAKDENALNDMRELRTTGLLQPCLWVDLIPRKAAPSQELHAVTDHLRRLGLSEGPTFITSQEERTECKSGHHVRHWDSNLGPHSRLL